MDILQTIQNISVEVQVTIGFVVAAIILGAFVYHWTKNRFTLASAITGLLSAAVVGWAAGAGIGWLSDQISGTVENNSARIETAYTLTTLV